MHASTTGMIRPENSTQIWALVLAGGDGKRLRDITRMLTGTPIPKQYCRITGARSMLEATLDRIGPMVPPQRTLVIVNRDHLSLALPQLADLPRDNVLVQPCNRDTGPGILWSLLEVTRRAPDARVAMFPSDHYVGDDAAFRSAVRAALRVVERHPDRMALLGIEPEEPSSEYGYVMPSTPLPGHDAAFGVASFREKPDPTLAARIVRHGGLWNSFVMAYRASRVLDLIGDLLPDERRALAGATVDRSILEGLYATSRPWNFSTDFLGRVASELVVVRAENTGWSDWGTPSSIERTFAALNRVPPWQVPALERYRPVGLSRQSAA